jgi:multidrug efflux pump subunit AcrA (membrane-fusion protein)
MRKVMTLATAVAMMVSLLALPASAATLDELEEAVRLAQAAVDHWEDEVERLEGEITAKETEVAPQQDIVDDLEADLAVAENELALAEARLAELVAIQTACDELATPKLQNDCRNPTNQEYNGLRNNVIPHLAGIVDGIVGELEEAEGALTELQGELTALQGEKALAESELAEAEAALAAAKAELDAYNPAAPHPGCKGINNAQEQVAKNVPAKGKAPAALAAVADKLGC